MHRCPAMTLLFDVMLKVSFHLFLSELTVYSSDQ